MLTIIFYNGKLHDVGFIEEEKAYYITVVDDDTLESWNNTLKVIKINNKHYLLDSIQEMIYFYVKIVLGGNNGTV